ncbi:unnamed protein product [Symbiodinium necroappetens]|uniref:Broad-range acid phosphatase DET1 n=1 Tax=Symbiodinium necroappetens TaxID=1628268 RepID=A0A812JXS4_9DINO|nr:unnamed protein product [Symbiodinium necroappetens]
MSAPPPLHRRHLLLCGVLGGASGLLAAYGLNAYRDRGVEVLRRYAEARREKLPLKIILVRHGQSEGNLDKTLFKTKGDNLMELTELGSRQAVAVGKRVKKVVHDEKVHFYVSPFQRTLQTARNMIFSAFDPYQVVDVSVDPRIREQEFGNLQGDNFVGLRQESTKIRRFWYRFPTGESGADVYDRTRQWWDSMMDRHLMEQSGASSIIVVTHGLTMRLILMQLFHWSPNTFHTVWNPDNCAMYVLQKNMSSSAHYPYFVDEAEGDRIMSSIDLVVTFQDNSTKQLTMVDYLSIPPPRTLQLPAVKQLLAEQFGFDPLDIKGIDFYNGIFQRFKLPPSIQDVAATARPSCEPAGLPHTDQVRGMISSALHTADGKVWRVVQKVIDRREAWPRLAKENAGMLLVAAQGAHGSIRATPHTGFFWGSRDFLYLVCRYIRARPEIFDAMVTAMFEEVYSMDPELPAEVIDAVFKELLVHEGLTFAQCEHVIDKLMQRGEQIEYLFHEWSGVFPALPAAARQALAKGLLPSVGRCPHAALDFVLKELDALPQPEGHRNDFSIDSTVNRLVTVSSRVCRRTHFSVSSKVE